MLKFAADVKVDKHSFIHYVFPIHDAAELTHTIKNSDKACWSCSTSSLLLHNSALCVTCQSPTYRITWAPLCVHGSMDEIIHCYPAPVIPCLLSSILPPVVYHHFHPIITPTPPGSLLWLLCKWDQSRSVDSQVWDHSHLLLCAVCVCVSVYCVHCTCPCVNWTVYFCSFSVKLTGGKKRGWLLRYRNMLFVFSVRYEGQLDFVQAAECVTGEQICFSHATSHVYLHSWITGRRSGRRCSLTVYFRVGVD